tara:strand:- start:928 stop:1131 length:204 start_codon:yes stop_codon:yes gene_type:complete
MRVCLLVFTLLCCSPLYAGEQLSVLLVNPSVKTDLFWQKVTNVMQVAAKQIMFLSQQFMAVEIATFN